MRRNSKKIVMLAATVAMMAATSLTSFAASQNCYSGNSQNCYNGTCSDWSDCNNNGICDSLESFYGIRGTQNNSRGNRSIKTYRNNNCNIGYYSSSNCYR